MSKEQNRGEIIIYRAEDNTVQLDVRMEHELTKEATVSKMETVQMEGKRENTVRFLHIDGVR